MASSANRPVLVSVIGWCCIAGAAAALLWAGMALTRPSSQRYRADAMILRAQALDQAKAGDRAAAADTLELALQAAEYAYRNTQVLSAIAEAQAATGDQAAAARTFEQAVESALQMGFSDQMGALHGIANVQARVGDGPGARKTAALIQNSATRDSVLQSVGIIQAESGDVMAARKTLSLVQYVGTRTGILHAIAVAQAKSGDGRGARETAETIPYEYHRARALGAIAVAQTQAGSRGDAPVAIEQAFKTAMATRKPEERARILGFIAGTQAVLGDPQAATLTLEQATHLAKSIRNPEDRERALHYVRRAEAQGRGKTEAPRGTRDWEITREQIVANDIKGALQTAAAMQDEHAKAYALREIAEAQAEAGDLAGARNTAALIEGKDKLPFWLGIVAFMSFILTTGVHFLRLKPWARLALEISSWTVVLILGLFVIVFIFAPRVFDTSFITGLATIESTCLVLLVLLRQSSVKSAFASGHAQGIQQTWFW